MTLAGNAESSYALSIARCNIDMKLSSGWIFRQIYSNGWFIIANPSFSEPVWSVSIEGHCLTAPNKRSPTDHRTYCTPWDLTESRKVSPMSGLLYCPQLTNHFGALANITVRRRAAQPRSGHQGTQAIFSACRPMVSGAACIMLEVLRERGRCVNQLITSHPSPAWQHPETLTQWGGVRRRR